MKAYFTESAITDGRSPYYSARLTTSRCHMFYSPRERRRPAIPGGIWLLSPTPPIFLSNPGTDRAWSASSWLIPRGMLSLAAIWFPNATRAMMSAVPTPAGTICTWPTSTPPLFQLRVKAPSPLKRRLPPILGRRFWSIPPTPSPTRRSSARESTAFRNSRSTRKATSRSPVRSVYRRLPPPPAILPLTRREIRSSKDRPSTIPPPR